MTTVITDGNCLIADRMTTIYHERTLLVEESNKIIRTPHKSREAGVGPSNAFACSGDANLRKVMRSLLPLVGHSHVKLDELLKGFELKMEGQLLSLTATGEILRLSTKEKDQTLVSPRTTRFTRSRIRLTNEKPFAAIGSGSRFVDFSQPHFTAKPSLVDLFLTCTHLDPHSGSEYSIFDRHTGVLINRIVPKPDFVKAAFERVIALIDYSKSFDRPKRVAKFV